ncbi:MAG: CPBP family intramembrane glutamic endopeptidase [Pseudanabaenaceae cyanobacterium bins.68]|nr:CPBP family intramembrane glutamic endopeptidase [Pseudanabaenaceae cyanobacterium bins.68]
MTNPPPPIVLSRSQVLVVMLVTAFLLIGLGKLWVFVLEVPNVPLNISWQNFAIGLGLGCLVSLASYLVYQVWADYRTAANTYLEMVLKPLEMPDLIWLGLLPGLSEEFLFRGVALPSLGMNWTAIAITSVVFGILHMAEMRYWQYTLWAALVGAGFGTVTLYTNSLLPAVTAHILTNSLSGMIWKLRQEQPN